MPSFNLERGDNKEMQNLRAGETPADLGFQEPYPVIKEPRPSRWRWLLIAILVLSAALVMVIGAGIWGYYDGLKDREETLRVQALEHYSAGVAHMQNAQYVLAQAEFEESLRLQPDLKQAWDKLRETQARMMTLPTPTSMAMPAAAPSPTPEAESLDLDSLLSEARDLYRAGNYLEAISQIERILGIDPDYESAQVEDILFNCYYRQALALISEERLEEAIHLLDLALALRPEDAAAKMERDLAAGYLTALGYWGAEWRLASLRFLKLYEIRPDYRDVASRLFEARVEEADLLSQNGDWCSAVEWYDLALQMRSDQVLAAKREEMVDYCDRGVPTPTREAEDDGTNGTPAAEGTPTATGSPSAATSETALKSLGLSGTIYYAVWDETLRSYVIYGAAVDGSDFARIVEGMHQPRVNHAGTQLVARARGSVKTLGLYLVNLTSGEPPALSMITSHVDDLYPSFSPDDQQVAFTSNRMNPHRWTLYTTWIDGQSDPQTVVEGQTPAWSPVGDRIAYKGCDPGGNNCGIWTVSQNGAENERIVTDPSAGFPTWSPNGKQIAFMSNRDGNWDIYLVGSDGSGLRRLTRSTSSEGLPAWSPDGEAIAYVSDRDGRWAIYMQRVDSGLTGKLVELETTYEDWLAERISWGPSL